MTFKRAGFLYALVGLLVLLANLPAHWFVPDATQGKGPGLRVLGSTGTVWAGQLQLGISDGARVYAIPDPLRWDMKVANQGQWLGLEFQHSKLTQPVHLAWGSGGITLSAGRFAMPAAWLAAWGAPFNTIRPEGLVQINWEPWNKSVGAVNASLTWLDAQSALASIRPLGEYVMTVTGNPGTKLEVALQTTRGPLMLEGQGQWTAGQRFVFNGYASAQAGSREALTGLLSQMGRQEGERYRLGVF